MYDYLFDKAQRQLRIFPRVVELAFAAEAASSVFPSAQGNVKG